VSLLIGLLEDLFKDSQVSVDGGLVKGIEGVIVREVRPIVDPGK
jgi:hypothetical protein